MKYNGTVLKVRRWIFSYGVEQIWDQLEKYANLERQKSQDAQGFGGKVSAVGEKGCSVLKPVRTPVTILGCVSMCRQAAIG